MRYTAAYVHKLNTEALRRYEELQRVLDTHHKQGDDLVVMDGMRVRLAVDDFKAILTEIRKLK